MSIPNVAIRRRGVTINFEGQDMKYLCLAYYDPKKFADMPPAEVKALVSQCPARDAELRKTGKLLLSASLGGAEAAFALRPRGGKPQLTDGPYTESKELVGGFFIIEAADRQEAVRVASIHPAANLGEQVGWGIEIHPIGFFQQYEATDPKASHPPAAGS
jgi:hypothetical protein